jgi:hypothetical protein
MFSIPNQADAAFTAQAEPDSKDIEILAAGAAGHGVIQGCAVSAQGSPDMTVAVAAGTVQVNGRRVRKVAAGNVNIGAANATNPRIDLVCVDGTGTKQVIAGTAGPSPVMPAITDPYVVLAAVYVPANDTAINANQIVDKRMMLPPVAIAAPGVVRVYSDFSNTAADGAFTQAVASGVITQAVGTSSEWGKLQLSTSTTAGGEAQVRTDHVAGLLGGGELRVAVAMATGPTLSNATDSYYIIAGLSDGVQSSFVDAVAFRYNHGVNAGKWECITRSNSTLSTADSGVAVATDTRYLLEIELNADATLAAFFINGSQVATLNTNIPSGAGRNIGAGCNIQKIAGTAARTCFLDKIEMIFLPLSPY